MYILNRDKNGNVHMTFVADGMSITAIKESLDKISAELTLIADDKNKPIMTFMNAVVISDGHFDYNIDKCREIQIQILKRKRNAMLEKYDSQMLRNFTNTTILHAIELKKQALRDLPEKMKTDLAKLSNVNDIANYVPVELQEV